jgi:hypothetical protein
MKKHKEPTAVSLVFAALVRADDFRTAQQVQAESGVNSRRVNSSLHMLRTYKAAQCMESDGQLWWYATPQDDTRMKTFDERTPEVKPRKSRKKRAL